MWKRGKNFKVTTNLIRLKLCVCVCACVYVCVCVCVHMYVRWKLSRSCNITRIQYCVKSFHIRTSSVVADSWQYKWQPLPNVDRIHILQNKLVLPLLQLIPVSPILLLIQTYPTEFVTSHTFVQVYTNYNNNPTKSLKNHFFMIKTTDRC